MILVTARRAVLILAAWSLSHHVAVHAYVHLCAQMSSFGLLTAPVTVAAPHCLALRWAVLSGFSAPSSGWYRARHSGWMDHTCACNAAAHTSSPAPAQAFQLPPPPGPAPMRLRPPCPGAHQPPRVPRLGEWPMYEAVPKFSSRMS